MLVLVLLGRVVLGVGSVVIEVWVGFVVMFGCVVIGCGC